MGLLNAMLGNASKIETTGTFDADAELKLWLAGAPGPLQKQFGKNSSIFEIQSLLASYVLR